MSLAAGAERLRPDSIAELVRDIAGANRAIWRDVIAEHWLTGPRGRVDLMGALSNPRLVSDRLRGELEWLDNPVIAAWLEPEDPLPSPVIWFEWDDPARAARPPMVSVCVSNRVIGEAAERRAPSSRDEQIRLVARTLELFDELQALERIVELLARCPAGSDILHIASLRARGHAGVRVVLQLPANAVAPCLRACAWAGSIEAVVALVGASVGPFRNVLVQLEIRDGGFGRYLGIETTEYCYRPPAMQLRAWITRLAELGAVVDEGSLEGLLARLRPAPTANWTGPDRLYCKAGFDGRWQAKAYLAAGEIG